MSEKKKEKGPKTLLGIFEIIPDLEESEDDEKTIKLMMDSVKTTIEGQGSIESYKVEEIAYGAKKIIARIVFKEMDGGSQPLEDAIGTVENVLRVECGMVSLSNQ